MASRTPPDMPDHVQDDLITDGPTSYDEGDLGNYSADRIWLAYSTTYPFPDIYPNGRDVQPEDAHFHALLHQIVQPDRFVRGPAAIALHLRKVQAAYVCCFGRSQMFREQLDAFRWRPFRAVLIDRRRRLMVDLVPHREKLRAQRKRVSRKPECWAAPLGIEGATTLDIVKQLTPDDWHQIALEWNWDSGVEVLDWITSQSNCDRATAALLLARANLEQVAECTADGRPRGAHWRFCWDLAERICAGAFEKAELAYGVSTSELAYMEQAFAQVRATGRAPWMLPEDLAVDGPRKHQPRYAFQEGRAPQIGWHYDYWLDHVAPPR